MAGSYFHLWLACRAWGKTGLSQTGEGNGHRAFLAGSVAPDLGFFPGGSELLSRRFHQERSGDFLRALLARARDQEEVAFAAGWGLHLCADWVVHPWVNDLVRALLDQPGKELKGNADLWHLRLEWGIDCSLLEREELRCLWELPVRFPRRSDGDCLLAEVGQAFYGQEFSRREIARGERTVERWLRELPPMLLKYGKIRPVSWRSIPKFASLRDGITRLILGEWLAEIRRFKIHAALASPWLPSAAKPYLVDALAERSLDFFETAWAERFVSFADLELREGIPKAIPPSP